MNITGHTGLFGIFATPIRHSISPAMHNEAFRLLGLDYVYLAFDVQENDLKSCITAMRAMNIKGANISMPYKSAVMEYLDEISDEAKLIGAVNTITNDNGYLKGYNTDGIGFMKSLEENDIDIKNKKIVIAGCGGAATAIIMQAAMDGVKEISVFLRGSSFEKRRGIIDRVNAKTDCRATIYDIDDEAIMRREIEESVLIINATNLGMKPYEGQTWLKDASLLSSRPACADLIYSPPETELLRIAKKAGCKVLNGSGMLLYQGAAAFKLWTGMDMPIYEVRKAVGL